MPREPRAFECHAASSAARSTTGLGSSSSLRFDGVAQDHVAAGGTGDVQPEVARLGHAERQPVVLQVALADEDLETLALDGPEAPALAAHRADDTGAGPPLSRW